MQTQERDIVGELKTAETSIERIRGEMEQEIRRLSEEDGGQSAARRRELDQKNEVVSQLKQNIEEHKSLRPALEDHQARAERSLLNARENVGKHKETIEEAQQRLDTLVRDRGQQHSAYPAGLPRLQKAIQEDSGFRERPVGPLGTYVRLTKPAWSSVLEKSFGQTLDSFIVTNKEDQIRLSSLMQRVNW